MELSEDIRLLRDAIDEFGKKELLDAYQDREPKGEFPQDLVDKISQMGLMGISFPEEYGGMDMNTTATSVAGERLAFYWPSLQLIWSANVSLAGFPIMTFGNDEQKRKFLPRLATGEILGCYALTEPEAGSDAAAIKSIAVRVGPHGTQGEPWVIKGVKLYITNADVASVGVVFAKRPPGGGKEHERISAFIIDSREAGFRDKTEVRVTDIPKWGLKCCHFSEVVLDNVEVKDEMMLGGPQDGWRIAMETLNNGRINIAAQAVGIARRALYEAETYGTHRIASGKPIIKFHVQADRLKRLKRKVEEVWQLTLEASCLKDSGADYRVAAAKAKLAASEIAVRCAMFNYRINGGFGYTMKSVAMPILHDALATITYEGTSDIQRIVIAKSRKS